MLLTLEIELREQKHKMTYEIQRSSQTFCRETSREETRPPSRQGGSPNLGSVRPSTGPVPKSKETRRLLFQSKQSGHERFCEETEGIVRNPLGKMSIPFVP